MLRAMVDKLLVSHAGAERIFPEGGVARLPMGDLAQSLADTPGLVENIDALAQVCQAIQHAHQKGVIHRDIEPSNILITIIDGMRVPKVIDFGIAKAVAGRLTDNTMFTAYEQFIGTPAYMSPEQAVMSGVDVDTRSDNYSLGVLLYELLTGRTLFETNALLEHGLDGLRRTLQDREPQRPSAIVTTLQGSALTQVAHSRHAEPLKLISLLRGDLDWIVIRTLEKDRARRYETANGLAMDVQRYLDNEPIMARPPSRVYRLQKLVRRIIHGKSRVTCSGPAPSRLSGAINGATITFDGQPSPVIRAPPTRYLRNAPLKSACLRQRMSR